MANANRKKNRHIVLQNVTETQRFRPPSGGGISPDIPELNRDKHAAALRKQLNIVRIEGESAVDTQRAAGMKEGLAGRGGRGVVEEPLAEARVVSDSLDLANSAKKNREFYA